MGSQAMIMAAPNLISIGIDQYGSGECRGRIWHQYKDEPVPFNGVMELLGCLEHLYDVWSFPQSSTRLRTFSRKPEATNQKNSGKVESRMDTERVHKKHGDRGTFIVRVKYRQNSTWQGEVVWAEKEQKQSFRSALELLKLIDSALDKDNDTGQEPESGGWDDR